ncbi:MAG: chorismate synthase [Planctomycetaceae bacterium]|nr:chorismate synthase [Planctomycetaceae bacterium]
MNCKTAGESHGHGILALVEGFPAGITIDIDEINAELKRRQGGYGRGGRQAIETDTVEILTGVWQYKNHTCQSTGAPITLWVKNKDYRIDTAPEITAPRPGHADLAGSIKFNEPIRPVLERASARETAARVAAGALAKQYLKLHGITVVGYVAGIKGVSDVFPLKPLPVEELIQRRNESELYTVNHEHDNEYKQQIDTARRDGDSLGGVIEAVAFGVPIGLGSCMQWDEKLDGKIAQAVMSVQAIKSVEIGMGIRAAYEPGSKFHDPIQYSETLKEVPGKGFVRPSNNAGGIEGGMSNGMPIVVRAAMKPIPTLVKGLPSIDINTKEPKTAGYERSDVCAVPAASVVLENVLAMEIAKAMLER